ncbi:cation/H+ exchanger [Athelia psychrophila]|uniref:Cation/H+ exchanger n=1 Tax=Athelia psychrophila TaxID=1759441 RepID=A0A167XLT3_9AGAM|nr:cation/H+ exchanger [Fibularhizoctonia sp. CBS 109695]
MGQLSNELLDFARALKPRAAPSQAGLFSGDNPSKYNATDPLQLWVIQVVIIVVFTQALGLLLGRIRQPRVIAEVIGGVFLGPSVLGRIPGFTARIFPDAGAPFLSLTSTIGLVLFLFLVGLEIDVRVVKRNFKASLAISVAGLIFPLGLGAALGVAVYREFINPEVNFGYFVLFCAVAVGITAFPVLCRILTELKLLDTTVGVVVLSAGVGNDIVGWILLALTVALVNAGSGIDALYVLLTSVGYVLFLLYPVRFAFRYLARRTGSLETGQPTNFMMTITLLIVFISAFFTDIIGVHPIFGGFLAGLIIPHDNGYAISVVEKLEDLVSIIFLPLYFTYSGLRTNLGLLNDGTTWGYVVLICTVSFFSKFISCFAAAKIFGFNLRESGAIGALMSCKGLVELIVLNVGLQAGILDTRTFSMFVVHAIILTFMTTPLTLLMYPKKYRIHASAVASDGRPSEEGAIAGSSTGQEFKTRFAVVLDKIEQLPAVMTLMQLLQASPASSSGALGTSNSSVSEKAPIVETPLPQLALSTAALIPRVSIDALRLIELTDRTSAVLKSQAADSLLHSDPVVSIFRTYGHLNRMAVSASLNVVPSDEFSSSIARHVRESKSQVLIVPWCRGAAAVEEGAPSEPNPFDTVFKATGQDQTNSVIYSNFIRKVFLDATTDVALFVDRGINTSSQSGSQHVFLPFFGGPDDRLALSFVVQLCANPLVTATVARIHKTEPAARASVDTVDHEKAIAINNSITGAETVYGQGNTQTRLQSDTADNLAWAGYTDGSRSYSPAVTASLGRINFSIQSSAAPLHAVVDKAASEIQQNSGRTLIVVVGRSRRLAPDSHTAELQEIVSERGAAGSQSVARTLGPVGGALVAASTNASLLVMQACLVAL